MYQYHLYPTCIRPPRLTDSQRRWICELRYLQCLQCACTTEARATAIPCEYTTSCYHFILRTLRNLLLQTSSARSSHLSRARLSPYAARVVIDRCCESYRLLFSPCPDYCGSWISASANAIHSRSLR